MTTVTGLMHFTYDMSDQPVAMTGDAPKTIYNVYDAAGQLIRDKRMESDVLVDDYIYHLNARGRMNSVTLNGAAVADYVYDESEQRIIKALPGEDPIHYHYDSEGRLISETNGATGLTLREYIWLGLTPISVIVQEDNPAAANDNTGGGQAGYGGGVSMQSMGCSQFTVSGCDVPDNNANDNEPAIIPVIYFLHADHLGRPQYTTKQDGSVVWSGGIKTPFGEAITTAGAMVQNLMFSGHIRTMKQG